MANGLVVSDTTPLINLVGIGLLDLLPQVYGSVSVPQAVADEFATKAASSDPDLTHLPWLTIVDGITVDCALPKLGLGEAAGISLAKAQEAQLVLIDERKARRVALSQGLQVAGTLAVLVRAKNQGLIQAIKPYIQTMETQGRRFSEVLIDQVLKGIGE
ncbi:MAG TPA: DUF3368 domain-containing protein [Ktedonobacterales bacterium]